MNSAGSKKEKAKVFEMLLSSPGMTEPCKISLKISRQQVLLLCRLIESGIHGENAGAGDEFLGSIPPDMLKDFQAIYADILQKSGLSDFYEKLKAI